MKQTSRITSRERTDMFYKSQLNDSNNSIVTILISLFAIVLVLFLLFGKNFIK